MRRVSVAGATALPAPATAPRHSYPKAIIIIIIIIGGGGDFCRYWLR